MQVPHLALAWTMAMTTARRMRRRRDIKASKLRLAHLTSVSRMDLRRSAFSSSVLPFSSQLCGTFKSMQRMNDPTTQKKGKKKPYRKSVLATVLGSFVRYTPSSATRKV